MTYTAEHWRKHETALRERAKLTSSDTAYRASLIHQAEGYQRMAELAERKGAPKEERAQCATCTFCREVYTDSKIGYCHRYPPTTPEVQVLSTTWCGEWKQRNG